MKNDWRRHHPLRQGSDTQTKNILNYVEQRSKQTENTQGLVRKSFYTSMCESAEDNLRYHFLPVVTTAASALSWHTDNYRSFPGN